MNEAGVPDLEDATEAAKAATGLMAVVDKLFPGIAIKSSVRGESWTIKRYMKDAAKYRKRARDEGYSEDFIAMMCDNMYASYTRRERFEHVVEFAEESLSQDADLHEPEQSWAEDFREHAERACDEDVRRMWGKVLAGEMEKPGSFSKFAMDILSKMGRREAEAFERLCSVSVGGKWQEGYQHIVPVVYGFGPEGSWDQLVDNDSLAALGRYGLIYYRPDMILPVDAGVPQTKEMPCRLVIEGVSYLVANETGHDVFWPNIKLTDEGNQLATLCRTGNAPGFHNQVIEGLEQRGCVVCLEARG